MVHRSGDPAAYGEGLKNLTPEELQELDQLVTPRLAQLLTKAYPDAGQLLAPFLVGDFGAAGPTAIGPQAAPPIRPPVAIPPTAGAAPVAGPVGGAPIGAPIGAGGGVAGPPRTALRRVGRF